MLRNARATAFTVSELLRENRQGVKSTPLSSKIRIEKTTNWNKYKSKVTSQTQYQYLDLLVNPSFQGLNRLFYHSTMKIIEKVIKDIVFQLYKQKIITNNYSKRLL